MPEKSPSLQEIRVLFGNEPVTTFLVFVGLLFIVAGLSGGVLTHWALATWCLEVGGSLGCVGLAWWAFFGIVESWPGNWNDEKGENEMHRSFSFERLFTFLVFSSLALLLGYHVYLGHLPPFIQGLLPR